MGISRQSVKARINTFMTDLKHTYGYTLESSSIIVISLFKMGLSTWERRDAGLLSLNCP